MSEWLASRELQPIRGSGFAAGGFPRAVERDADHRKLVWHDGVYLPEHYEPDPAQGRAGRNPLALVPTMARGSSWSREGSS